PKEVRSVLEAMLESPESLVRQAAAFGLGELGGKASVKRLERQLAIEEAGGGYSGDAVVEDITRALGKIGEASARAALARRLERLAAGKPAVADVNELAYALWRRRHSDLIPAVRRSLETLSLPEPHCLHGLLVLLEKSPEALDGWARDPAVPINHKRRALAVLEEDVPDMLIPILPAFIATAHALREQASRQEHDAAYYCERLFSLVLGHRQRIIPALPAEARAELRAVARSLLTAPSMGSALPAAVMLELVGRPEDVALLESRRPADDPGFAKVFDDAARVLRNLH
ncbi:MAG TPA: hypothetical protein VNA24_36535, partial [Hyalangium sp.]|nr:hypothetical protein [Hyalangium sp.]